MKVTRTPDVQIPLPATLPASFDSADRASLEGAARALREQRPRDASQFRLWVEAWSELEDAVRAGGTRRNIAFTCDTGDEAARKSHQHYQGEILPLWRKLRADLVRAYLDSPHRASLGAPFGEADRAMREDAALYREENLSLLSEEAALKLAYARLTGGLRVFFRGGEMTAPQCRALYEEKDRETRRDAYFALAKARGGIAEEAETIFDRLVALRHQIARNAGCVDYREYRFRELHRFDYTPADCLTFHDSVERVVLPAVQQDASRRAEALGLERLRPWDLDVDPAGGDPLHPFTSQEELVALALDLFGAVDPRFRDEFAILDRNALLDLLSRPGKAPGGYNSSVNDIRLPFIFMNAVGRHDDVETMLHEGGHAFHTLACRNEPLTFLRSAPMEFNEVASMAMELFGLERLVPRYAAADAKRVLRHHLEERLLLLGWIATIDAFQHWIYTTPGHDRSARGEMWRTLRARFSPQIDFEGLEEFRAREWQAQLHLFHHPFYYIEYGFASLGALQLWRNERRDHAGTIEAYRSALALGGTRSLTDLYAAAGVRFGADEALFREVVAEIRS